MPPTGDGWADGRTDGRTGGRADGRTGGRAVTTKEKGSTAAQQVPNYGPVSALIARIHVCSNTYSNVWGPTLANYRWD